MSFRIMFGVILIMIGGQFTAKSTAVGLIIAVIFAFAGLIAINPGRRLTHRWSCPRCASKKGSHFIAEATDPDTIDRVKVIHARTVHLEEP